MRDLIVESWHRSVSAGVDADRAEAPFVMERGELDDYREAHPLSAIFPLLYDVLGAAAKECDCVMGVGDDSGRLLWVCGRPGVLRQADGIRFVEGTDWREAATGTNAPGTAIALDRPIQIGLREHYSVAYKDWSCSAAPIHDPETHRILGVVDVTGQGAVDTPQTLAMVHSAARMAEAELGRLQLQRRLNGSGADPLAPPSMRLSGLGRPDIQLDDGTRLLRLSRRHSDILTILADRPEGTSADQLAVDTYDDDVQPSTMRAQMTRLRQLLGGSVLDSRPYRLAVEVVTDWGEVLSALRTHQIGRALRLYRGPLLPLSDAPGVVELRDSLERAMVDALLTTDNPDLLVSATWTRWAGDNLQLWERQVELLPRSSPLFGSAVSEMHRLRVEYGLDHLLPNRLHRL